jgi:O-antigen biosynthesis protein
MLDGAQDYEAWRRAFAQPTLADRTAIAGRIAAMPLPPRFLVVPLIRREESPALWEASLRSVRSQTYPHWQLAIPASWDDDGRAVRQAMPAAEPPGERRAFLAVTLSAGDSESDFILPLLPDTRLDDMALYEFAVMAEAFPRAAVLFGDEDRCAADGSFVRPRFKTAYDPELMLGRDALGLPVAYRSTLLTELGGLRRGTGPIDVALHDLALRTSERVLADQFVHVPVVLCHRQETPAAAPTWSGPAARHIVLRHLEHIGTAVAAVEPAPLAPAWVRVRRALQAPPPLVSVIVPTRDHPELLASCMDGLLRRTDYPALEILIVDNGSTMPEALSLLASLAEEPSVRVLHCPGPFNYSALNNRAAHEAGGELLLLLNSDTGVLEPGWLREMVTHAERPEVGAVGAKLLYADSRVQHAGVVLGRGQNISHQLRLAAKDDPGPHGELALTRTVLAVTGACLMTRRSVFWEVGGLDETQLPIALNDVDFCLRLADHGYRVVWTPFAELQHFESASRGDDMADAQRQARFLRELAIFSRRWVQDLLEDPFHNPNIEFGWGHTGFAAPPRRAPSWVS